MNRRARVVLGSLALLLLASCGSSTDELSFTISTSQGECVVYQCDGNTKGFWANKNGQALILPADVLALANDFALRNEDGTEFNPAAKAELIDFLRGANAKNMANQLSAQWIAFYLNAQHTLCEDVAFYFPKFAEDDEDVVPYADLEAAVAAALADGSSASRAWMELLKTFLDRVNNDLVACVCEPPTGATGATGSSGSSY